MNKKAVFFDADGTVCDIKKGVPDSAVRAITQLVENGHEAWLCTGRSRAFVPWYLEQIPFTGMISACGATITKCLSDTRTLKLPSCRSDNGILNGVE